MGTINILLYLSYHLAVHTFICLCIGDLQIKICILADLLLMKYRFLQILDGYVKTVESDRVVRDRRLELVVNRHGRL